VERKRRGKVKRRSKVPKFFFVFDAKKKMKLTYVERFVLVQNICSGSKYLVLV